LNQVNRAVARALLAVALPLLAPALAVLADEDPAATLAPPAAPTPGAPGDRRLLNGHAFPPSQVAPPIAVSSFGLESEFSAGNATGPTFDIHGNPVGENRTYGWVGMGQAVRFQSIFHEQLALRGALTTAVASGSDGMSVLVVGSSVQVGVSLGAEWSVAIGEALRLGASLDVSSDPQLNLLVAAAVIHALKNGAIDSATALGIGRTYSVLPALSAAWAPSPAWGFAARLAWLGASADAGTYGKITRQGVELGLAADLDLDKALKVPIDLGLAYTETIPIDGTPAGIRNLSIGVMYMGLKDTALGLALGERILNIRPQYDIPLKSTSFYLEILLRVYWP
jgi:hypothetical protein